MFMGAVRWLLGFDARMRVHRAAHETPHFDVVEHLPLFGPDGRVGRCDEVHPLHSEEITVTDTVGSTAVATVQGHPLTLPSDDVSRLGSRMAGMTTAIGVVMVRRRREPYVPWT